MLTAINLSISLLIPCLVGYTLIALLFYKKPLQFPVALCYSYGLGLGVLSQWMLILGILRIPYGVRTIGFPLLFLSLFLVILKNRKRDGSPLKQISASQDTKILSSGTSPLIKTVENIFYVLLAAYILYYIIYVFWRALNVPVSSWDAIATAVLKSKVLFYERSLVFLKDLPRPSYPLHIPFVQAWIAYNLGKWSEQLIKIIFPCAFLSYLIIHYYFLSNWVTKKQAILGIVLLISSNLFVFHATISYRDFFLLYYNCITIMLLLLWNDKRDDAFLILASLFAGFSTFTKLEGTTYLFIYTLLFCLAIANHSRLPFRKKINKGLLFVIPSYAICFGYHIYKILLRIPTPKAHFDFTWDILNRTLMIFVKFVYDLFLSGNWNIVWFLLIFSLIRWQRITHKKEVKLLLSALIMFFGLYFLVGLLTVNFIYIGGVASFTGLSRLFLHFFPLSTLLIVFLNCPRRSVD